MLGLFLNLNLLKWLMTSVSWVVCVLQFIATAISRSWAGLEILGFMIHISSLGTTKCLISKSPQAVVKNLIKFRVILSVPCLLLNCSLTTSTTKVSMDSRMPSNRGWICTDSRAGLGEVATDIGSLVLPLAPILITLMGNDDSPDGNNPWKWMIPLLRNYIFTYWLKNLYMYYFLYLNIRIPSGISMCADRKYFFKVLGPINNHQLFLTSMIYPTSTHFSTMP